MRETQDQCDRKEELISWLYQESGEVEAQEFAQHMATCASCRKEAAAFQNVRGSIIAWREEFVGSRAVLDRTIVSPRKKSAAAAVREFFNLSPLWLKGAITCATVLFCVLAVFAVVRLRDTPTDSLAGNPATSTQVFQERVEERARQLAQEMRSQDRPSTEVATLPVNKNLEVKKGARRRGFSSAEVASLWNKRRPLSQEERQQLAADLRLKSSGDEADIDLIGDTNRR